VREQKPQFIASTEPTETIHLARWFSINPAIYMESVRKAVRMATVWSLNSLRPPNRAIHGLRPIFSFGSVTKNHDGAWPNGGVVFDGKGNLYGTTAFGGSGGKPRTCTSAGCGVVFELSPPAQQGDPWTETVLHNFTSVKDGVNPDSGMIFSNGNLYGTTLNGGTINRHGLGTVFQLTAGQGGTWTESVIYRFSHDPGVPKGALWGLTADQAGNLYGTTVGGGSAKTCPYGPCGAVYELQPPAGKGKAWTERTLFQFGGLDGLEPVGSLLLSNSGTLYGATEYGGAKREYCTSGCGTVFQIVP
jgi:hypothetical protein